MKTLKTIGLVLLPTVIFYFGFAYALWELNPAKWGGTARFFAASLSVVIGGFFYLGNEQQKS